MTPLVGPLKLGIQMWIRALVVGSWIPTKGMMTIWGYFVISVPWEHVISMLQTLLFIIPIELWKYIFEQNYIWFWSFEGKSSKYTTVFCHVIKRMSIGFYCRPYCLNVVKGEGKYIVSEVTVPSGDFWATMWSWVFQWNWWFGCTCA